MDGVAPTHTSFQLYLVCSRGGALHQADMTRTRSDGAPVHDDGEMDESDEAQRAPAIMLRRYREPLYVDVTATVADAVPSDAPPGVIELSDHSDVSEGGSGPMVGVVAATAEGSDPGEIESAVEYFPPICYVCEEIGQQPAFAVCACADRFLHLTCQRQLMTQTISHRLGCAVCQTAYTNVEIEASNRRLSQEGRRFVAYALGILCVLGISAYEAVMYAVMPDWSFLAVAVLFAIFGIVFSRIGCVLFQRMPLCVVDNVVTIGPPPGYPQLAALESLALPPPRSAPLSPPHRNSVLASVTQSGLTVLVLAASPLSRSPQRSPARIARIAVHPIEDPPLHEIHLHASSES